MKVDGVVVECVVMSVSLYLHLVCMSVSIVCCACIVMVMVIFHNRLDMHYEVILCSLFHHNVVFML